MSRSFRSIAAWSVALTLGAAGGAATAGAQATDSTRIAPPPPPGRGGMGPLRGMGPRAGFGTPRGADDRGPRAGMRGRRLDGARERPGVGARGFGAARRMRAGFLMRGITLSAEQQRSLRTNQARHITASKPLMLELLSARTDQQLAHLNGDQRALDAATARITTARARLDSLREKRSPVEDLRAVLTPEQQKLLDRNLGEAAQGGGAAGPMRGNRMAPRAMRPGVAPRGFRDGPFPPRRGGDDEGVGMNDDELDTALFGWLGVDDVDEPLLPPAGPVLPAR